jgi:hypothetical protein
MPDYAELCDSGLGRLGVWTPTKRMAFIGRQRLAHKKSKAEKVRSQERNPR